jgi:membrane peptidoglycan carboxypeptidase
MAARLGITSLPRTGPRAITRRSASLTLGSYEVSPVEMAAAYATFAANGVACKPIAILSMTDVDGQPIRTPSAGCHQAISPGVATTVTSVLRGVLGPGGTADGLGLAGRPAAGKTGTTSNNGGTWFVGYTPQYSTAVWVGDPKGQQHSLHNVTAYGVVHGTLFGATVAAPIWQDVMNRISTNLPVLKFSPPDPAVLSGGTIRIPSVVGLARDAAITTLVQQGYRVRVAARTAPANPLLTPGFVAAQSPGGGVQGSYGQLITLTLTSGSDTRVVAPKPSALASPNAATATPSTTPSP